MKWLYYSCFLTFSLVFLVAYFYPSSTPKKSTLSFERLKITLKENRQDVKVDGCSGLTLKSSQATLIECVKNLQENWTRNSQKANELRYSLSQIHNAEAFATILKETTEDANISKKLQFKEKIYGLCNLIGSSGILSGSKCQKEIDSADFVLRFNAPKIAPFASDAGWKSNFTSLNPMGVIHKRYNKLENELDENQFILDMSQYNDFIWIPASFTKSKSHDKIEKFQKYLAIRASKTLYKSKLDIKVPTVLYGNVSHYKETQEFWASAGLDPDETYLTTGFYFTSITLSLCEEVRLYGFWPFLMDLDQQEIPFHYYDNAQLSYKQSWHDFKSEFFTLLKLHTEGILKLHVGKCQT